MTFIRDVADAMREFRRRPGAPIVIVLSLGFAMGLSTSLFVLVNAIWLKPWPVHASEQIRVVVPNVAAEEYQLWKEQARSFTGLAASRSAAVRLGGRMAFCSFVSANYLDVLHVPIVKGGPLPDDGEDGAALPVVISHRLWQTRFGGTADIIGTTITLEHLEPRRPAFSVTVVGVAGEGFEGVDRVQNHLWLPLAAARHFEGDVTSAVAGTVQVFGRLRPETAASQAGAELSVLSSRRRPAHDAAPIAVALRTTDSYSLSPPSFRTQLTSQSLLLGVVFITLIACANVANLTLARGYSRQGEIAVRIALGAKRARVVRQLVTESLALSVCSAAVGLLLASSLPQLLYDAFVRAASLDSLLQVSLTLDYRVFTWSLALSVIACCAFGIAPALRCTNLAVAEVLKEAQHNSRKALMPSLLSYQMIVAVMAITIAGLLLRSDTVVEAMRTTRLMKDLSIVRLEFASGLDGPRRALITSTIVDRLSTLSAGQDVAGLTGRVRPGSSQVLLVTPNYFHVVGMTLRSGRPFTAGDPADRVVVVNDALARSAWPGRDPVGLVIGSRDPGIFDRRLVGRHVVGVVASTHGSSPTAYLPADSARLEALLSRVPRSAILQEVRELTPRLGQSATLDVMSASDWIAPAIRGSQLMMATTAAFGLSALVLGAVGFFSLLEYSVRQRTREIGIRRALGAQPRDVIRSIALAPSRPLARGFVLGCVTAAVAAEFMRRAGMPRGVRPLDPATYVAVAAILVAVMLVAAYVPARRALRIEPARALRVE